MAIAAEKTKLPSGCRSFPGYHRPRWPAGPWPDDSQLLLLKACLLDNGDAVVAWKNWRSLFSLENIDRASERLLPLLFLHLTEFDLAASDRDQIADIVQRHCTRHEEQTRCLGTILRMLANAGIETLLLKGAALNLQVYRAGSRPMTDVDVVVPREFAHRAVLVLHQHGWESADRHPERLIDALHGCQFHRKPGQPLDLHWDFFHPRRLSSAEQQFLWQASVQVQIAGVATHVLSPTHQLLHTCVHGARWCATPPLRWLADACLIVRRCGAEINWDELAEVAQRLELSRYVWPTLTFLQERLDVTIPSATLRRLRQARTSVSGKLQHFCTVRKVPGAHPFWTSLPLHLVGYWRQRRQQRHLRLGEYLQLQHQFERPVFTYLPSLLRLQKAAAREALCDWARQSWRQLSGAAREHVVRMGAVARWRTYGFHEVQRWRGWRFRWSRPQASILFPDWPKKDCQVVVVLAGLPRWRQAAEDLHIKFNDRCIPARDIRIRDREIHFAISRNLLVSGRQQKLSFHCQPLATGNGDRRRLGIPICSIRIIEQKKKRGEPADGSERLSTRSDVPGAANVQLVTRS